MRLKLWYCSAVFLLAGSTVSPAADYTVNDILKFFASQEATRGICVGTEAECGLADRKPASHNLRLTFDLDSAILTEQAKDNLAVFAAALKTPQLSGANIAVDGFTDASGSEEHNLDLSVRRAKAVVTYLDEQGVDTGKLVAQGYGETNPLDGNPDNPANRRVETRLIVQ